MEGRQRVRNWRSLQLFAGCAFVPAAIFFLSKVLLAGIQDCNIPFASLPTRETVDLALGAAGRFVWFAAVLVTFSVGVYAMFLFIARIRLRPRAQWIEAGVLFLLVFTPVVLVLNVFGFPKNYECIGEQLFINSLLDIPLAEWLDFLPSLLALVDGVEGVVAAAAGLIVLGAAAIVHHEVDERDSIGKLHEKFETLRSYLYLGALLMVTGLMALRGFFFVPKPYLADHEVAAYEAMVDALLVYQGSVYVLMLAAMFGLPYVFLSQRARGLAEGITVLQDGHAARRAWLEQNGLKTKLNDLIAQMVAILSPLLAGPMGGLIDAVIV